MGERVRCDMRYYLNGKRITDEEFQRINAENEKNLKLFLENDDLNALLKCQYIIAIKENNK